MHQRRPRRAFTAAFKAEVVELCRKGDRSIAGVAGDLDLTETAVRQWVRQAEIDEGRRPGLATVIDLASRRVVGWAMANHLRAELLCEALDMAIRRRRPGPG